ncbi:Uncharacterised protein [Mycobacteroides abscessus subsp. abscessus]|nr:Uncharacterised protein [Mycobacteroides abscessus subsp. abscessus]
MRAVLADGGDRMTIATQYESDTFGLNMTQRPVGEQVFGKHRSPSGGR